MDNNNNKKKIYLRWMTWNESEGKADNKCPRNIIQDLGMLLIKLVGQI